MYFNDLEFKYYYEMKKEEMEKEIAANRYLIKNNKTPIYKRFLHVLQKKQIRKKSIVNGSNCCNISSHEVCC